VRNGSWSQRVLEDKPSGKGVREVELDLVEADFGLRATSKPDGSTSNPLIS
jgi:hypothetical protein